MKRSVGTCIIGFYALLINAQITSDRGNGNLTDGIKEVTTEINMPHINAQDKPIDDCTTLNFNDPFDHSTVRIMDYSGKILREKTIDEGQFVSVDLTSQLPGIYLIEVVNYQKETVYSASTCIGVDIVDVCVQELVTRFKLVKS